MSGQIGFWDVQDRLSQLSRHGDPLEKLSVTVDFEIFRAELAKAAPRGDRSKGGRPPFDPVWKFKMLVFQALNGLSLDKTEFLVPRRIVCELPPKERNISRYARILHVKGVSLPSQGGMRMQ